jgi:hypothetical protein
VETPSTGPVDLREAIYDIQTLKMKSKEKCKFVPVDVMKAYSGSRGIAPLTLNLDAN